MIELQDGMLLYHGSYIGIPAIDLNRCFGGLDFGRGFYLTSSYEQAYNYVQLSVRKAMRIGTVPRDFNPEDGQISVYKLDLCQYFEHKKLKGYADFFNSSSSFCCGVI